MNISTSTINGKYVPPSLSEDDIFYPDQIENFMPESQLHFWLINELASVLRAFFASREDVFVCGDLMTYYEKGNPKKFVAPDVSVYFGRTTKPPRGVYKLWEEKIAPSLIIEIASPTTYIKDVSSKLLLYQRLGVKEYYVFDAKAEFFVQSLTAFHLEDKIFVEQEVLDNRFFSKLLDLELVAENETLRFVNPKTNEILPTLDEAQAENERLKAEIERLKSERK